MCFLYEAQVEVNGIPKKSNGGKSTFFPDEWSSQKVVDSINEAYVCKELVDKMPSGSIWECRVCGRLHYFKKCKTSTAFQ
ncbi:EndoU domain-containing protein [Carnobacterium gallinarum]|nr:EndoU domain-containing protein [Carnobacterium gallinarum]